MCISVVTGAAFIVAAILHCEAAHKAKIGPSAPLHRRVSASLKILPALPLLTPFSSPSTPQQHVTHLLQATPRILQLHTTWRCSSVQSKYRPSLPPAVS